MGATPNYKIGDDVYLQSSAKVGFLEMYRISTVHQSTLNKWVYKIALGPIQPATFTVEDAINHKGLITTLYFDESELLSYESALQYQIDALTRKLNDAIAKRDALLE